MQFNYKIFPQAALAATLMAGGLSTAPAKTLSITDPNTKLSDAVADVYALDDGPDVIDIMVDKLSTDTTEIMLNQAITINGDADGNGKKCDILVDVTAIRGALNVGDEMKCYLEIESPGDVVINDLQIHPNRDNTVTGAGDNANLVDGIRFNRQADASTTPTHTLNRVWVSGSNAADEFVRLDTADDLYTSGGLKHWSRQSGSSAHGIIHIGKASTLGTGDFNVVLNNCHAGLGFGDALNIPAEKGHVTVNGGLYGHSGGHGIRVSGDTVSLTGSHTNRLRILRVPNVGGQDKHAIFSATGTFDKVEWVDIASMNTGRNLQVNGGIPVPMANCRLMGKLGNNTNPILLMTNNTSCVNMVDCTIVGSGGAASPFEAPNGTTAVSTFTDCIFTSENLGQINNNNDDTTGALIFTNCALPTDGVSAESLNQTTPISLDAGLEATPNYTVTAPVTVSPMYMLTRDDYDWSEAQGEGKPNNSKGNTNVYRPSNPAYKGAATNGDLVGGAGDFPAGIDAAEWMLM
jgi:hypothetical protein